MKSRASLWCITFARHSLVYGASIRAGSKLTYISTVVRLFIVCRFYVTGDYSWTCQPIDYSDNTEVVRALNLAWFFYISKFVDMFDSFFFVLKKKFTHLSFLHVYHHGIMPFQCWWGPRYLFYIILLL